MHKSTMYGRLNKLRCKGHLFIVIAIVVCPTWCKLINRSTTWLLVSIEYLAVGFKLKQLASFYLNTTIWFRPWLFWKGCDHQPNVHSCIDLFDFSQFISVPLDNIIYTVLCEKNVLFIFIYNIWFSQTWYSKQPNLVHCGFLDAFFPHVKKLVVPGKSTAGLRFRDVWRFGARDGEQNAYHCQWMA